ncbi:sphingosine hydroxylase [Fomitopsis serialis]|uniref:sphingosine hydroxylase n=1 Tax=Fomitopsis serialis TaxID=139415 RepID=UPI00200805F7|nr:sphingosine hydroxylase [Neoantrodia serialis]KAH9933340.1 sphingosine hydroxylase [Neoantrodia serialis]
MNSTAAPTLSMLSQAQVHYLSTNRPFYYSPHAHLFDWCPDHMLALAAPVIAYWVSSVFFHILDISEWKWLDKYRIHESAEVKSRNLVTRSEVIRAVVLQQIVQTEKPSGALVDHVGAILRLEPTLARILTWTLGEKWAHGSRPRRRAAALRAYWWANPVARFFFGMFLIDTWQYFLHRAMHVNRWLYKQFHSVHHRLYVPYAFGALYNHPNVAGMTTREAALLFLISSLKTVDDHCGYSLPFDPLQLLTSNNADYHDIHHQVIGIKSNFAQPFFVHWDYFLGTRMTRQDIEQRRQKQKKAS